MHDPRSSSSTADFGSAHSRLADLSLPALRRLLVEERARLRALQEQVRTSRAEAEQECIDGRGGDPKALGATQQDRERALVLFLNAHPRYQRHCQQAAHQERAVEAIQAEIEAARDVRREVEGERLDRYIQALVDLAGTPMVGAAALPGTPATHP
jgi:hypothetical protein